MTGKAYYLTTLGDWRRHAARFATSHFVSLDTPLAPLDPGISSTANAPRTGDTEKADSPAPDDGTKILVLVEADEGIHLALEDDVAFEQLPHPLAQRPISPMAQAALAQQGVQAGATTFETTEIMARVHPLLRHRVF